MTESLGVTRVIIFLSHDIEIKLKSNSDVILVSLCWNNLWAANIAMNDKVVSIKPFHEFFLRLKKPCNQISSFNENYKNMFVFFYILVSLLFSFDFEREI